MQLFGLLCDYDYIRATYHKRVWNSAMFHFWVGGTLQFYLRLSRFLLKFDMFSKNKCKKIMKDDGDSKS